MRIKEIVLITHNGVFHADDVMCAALLDSASDLFKCIRTNDPSRFMDMDNAIIADIGGGKYDHHQQDAQVRPDGQKHAACGLIFRDYWKYIFEEEKTANMFRDKYIIPIEDQDNGVASNPLSMMISTLNSLDDSEDMGFDYAVYIMKTLILAEQKAEQKRIVGREYLQCALKEADRTGSKYVVLERFVPWQELLVPSNAQFVVFPSKRGGWNVQTIPTELGGREAKKPLPTEWLEMKPEGCTFVHQGLFIAAFDTLEHCVAAL